MVAIFWWRADRIAAKVAVPATGAPPTPEGVWSVQNALSVAVAAAGLWVVIVQVPTLVLNIILIVVDIFDRAPEGAGGSELYWTNLVPALLTTALGLLCILGSQGIADFLTRLRRW